MKISTIMETIKTLTISELMLKIKTCERALLENKQAASSMSSQQKLLYAKPRAKSLEQALLALQRELQSRKQ